MFLYPLSQIATRSSGTTDWDVVRRLPHEASGVAVRANLRQGSETLSLRNNLEFDSNNQQPQLTQSQLGIEQYGGDCAPVKFSKFTRTVLSYQALSAGAKD